jgi:hypothetical protein
MRAKFINEKFEEHTDPISDMGIGGIILDDIHTKIEDEAAKKWIKWLKDTLEGKTIKGIMMKREKFGHDWKKWTIRVKKINNTLDRFGFSHEVSVTDDKGDSYSISTEKKIYIW